MPKISQRTIHKFKKGDKNAFEDIFYAYKDKLYYLAYFYVKDYDDANDCVQEIFIKVVNTIDSFDEVKSAFETWLYTIARSCIYNFLRSKKRYSDKITIDDDAVLVYKDEDFNELQHTLYDLESIMGREMYVVYILRTGYDMSFESIAHFTDSSRESTRRLYYQSLEIVNTYLGEENYETNIKTKEIN